MNKISTIQTEILGTDQEVRNLGVGRFLNWLQFPTVSQKYYLNKPKRRLAYVVSFTQGVPRLFRGDLRGIDDLTSFASAISRVVN